MKILWLTEHGKCPEIHFLLANLLNAVISLFILCSVNHKTTKCPGIPFSVANQLKCTYFRCVNLFPYSIFDIHFDIHFDIQNGKFQECHNSATPAWRPRLPIRFDRDL